MLELYVAYAPAAARLAYLLTGDRELGRVLARQAFVKLAGRFADLRDPFAFEAYLRSTVLGLTKKHHRRLTVERALARGSNGSGHTGRPAREATAQRLWIALQSLPLRQRAALVLRFYENLSELQTAIVLDTSTAVVRSLVARATGALGRPPLNGAEMEARLRGLLELEAEGMGARGDMPAGLRRKVVWHRCGWAAIAGAVVLSLALLAVSVGRTPVPALRADGVAGGRVSQSEFIDRADAICAPIDERISAEVMGGGSGHSPTPSDLAKAAGTLQDYSLLIDAELGQLSRLETPPGAARIWNRILSSSRLAMSHVGQAQRAAAHGHSSTFTSAMRASSGPRKRATRLATEYGFEHCVIR